MSNLNFISFSDSSIAFSKSIQSERREDTVLSAHA